MPERQPPPPLLHLDVDAHGRVVPGDDAARRALADRAGRFVLLPAAPDLLLARRSPAAGGPAPRPRCLLAGDLSAFPIGDFVAFVHQSRLTGLLTVSSGAVDRSVAFKDGEVRGAQSQAPGERVGEVALRLGFLGREELAAAADLSAGRTFGKVLVEQGLLSPADLWKCLHEQVAAVFHAILLAREGVFALVDEPELDLDTPLSVDTQSLLMDGIRRIDELSLFRERIPGPDAFLRRRDPMVPITLRPAEQQLLDLVDGRRRVAEIAQAAHLGEFDATKVLYHLAEAGYLEAVAEPAAPAASSAERVTAIAAGMSAALRLVSAAVTKAGKAEPFVAGVRTFLSDPSSRFAPLWKGAWPARDGGLEVPALLANLAAAEQAQRLGPPGDPVRYLLDGLRELVFFHLFQAGELLPRQVDEELGREVKRRFEALGELR